MDRLLGNNYLHQKIPMIYKGINELTIIGTKPVISVDWSCLSYAEGILPLDTKPIIVTDAIFSTLWFKKVINLWWHFVGRVRSNKGNYLYQNKWWHYSPVREAYQLATNIPNIFNHCLLTARNKLSCRMIIYKKLPQGRKKKNAKGCLAKGSYENALAKGSKDPVMV
jgi:hypothetical protein